MMQTHRKLLQHAVPSPDGALIATLQPCHLILSTYDRYLLRSIPLPAGFTTRCRFVRWSQSLNHTKAEAGEGQAYDPGRRILLADDDSVRLYDSSDEKWSAQIDKASGNVGRIAEVAFGFNPNEFLVFSDFGIKLTVWSVLTCRGAEIRDPKYVVHCYSFRPRTGHLAIMTRPAAQDILMLLNPGDHTSAQSVELPTVDAQEVSWSPNGQWLAIRDAASSGHKVYVYTADGHLFKTYTKVEDDSNVGLGIKQMEWCQANGRLLLGDYNDDVTVLSERNFSPIATFRHSSSLQLDKTPIWQEQLDAAMTRSYIIAPQPASPPTSASLTKANTTPTHGISVLAVNKDNRLLATKSDITPTTVWIWSLVTNVAVTVLIHHSPVKHIAWHPTEPDLLLIHCTVSEPAIHFWKDNWETPRIFTLPIEKSSRKLEARWLQSPDESRSMVFLSSIHSFATAHLTVAGEFIPQEPQEPFTTEGHKSTGSGAEAMFDEGNSLDLSPIKVAHDETIEIAERLGEDDTSSGFDNEMIDDTFHYRRHIRAAG